MLIPSWLQSVAEVAKCYYVQERYFPPVIPADVAHPEKRDRDLLMVNRSLSNRKKPVRILRRLASSNFASLRFRPIAVKLSIFLKA
jgi:hypothetical protein